METKICRECNQELPLSQFREHRPYCQDCERKIQREYKAGKRRTDPEWHEREKANNKRDYIKHREVRIAYMKTRSKDYMKNSFLKSVYGITLDDYHQMWDEQNGVCVICGQPETRKSRYGGICDLHVDHDHATGKVRGLLCHRCNIMLGEAQDDPQILAKAIEYLREKPIKQ